MYVCMRLFIANASGFQNFVKRVYTITLRMSLIPMEMYTTTPFSVNEYYVNSVVIDLCL